jgi:hypothetical protein
MPRRDVQPRPLPVHWRTMEQASCTSKETFRSRGEVPSDPLMRAYRCVFCRQWHRGHVPSMRTVRKLAFAIRARAQEAA